MLTKESQVPVTVTEVEDEGSFVALASTWEIDRQGERVRRGAFKESSGAGRTAANRCRLSGTTRLPLLMSSATPTQQRWRKPTKG